MESGKTKKGNDPAPEKALDIMSKKTPEYSMNKSELVYPGEGAPFSAVKARKGPTAGPHHAGTPAHAEAPPTEVPQNKQHLMPTGTQELIDVLTVCIAACERSVSSCSEGHDPAGTATCVSTSQACADMCKLLLSYLKAVDRPAIALMAKDLAPVCARACEACALECSKHSDMAPCKACEQACRACAKQCRTFAH